MKKGILIAILVLVSISMGIFQTAHAQEVEIMPESGNAVISVQDAQLLKQTLDALSGLLAVLEARIEVGDTSLPDAQILHDTLALTVQQLSSIRATLTGLALQAESNSPPVASLEQGDEAIKNTAPNQLASVESTSSFGSVGIGAIIALLAVGVAMFFLRRERAHTKAIQKAAPQTIQTQPTHAEPQNSQTSPPQN